MYFILVFCLTLEHTAQTQKAKLFFTAVTSCHLMIFFQGWLDCCPSSTSTATPLKHRNDDTPQRAPLLLLPSELHAFRFGTFPTLSHPLPPTNTHTHTPQSLDRSTLSPNCRAFLFLPSLIDLALWPAWRVGMLLPVLASQVASLSCRCIPR